MKDCYCYLGLHFILLDDSSQSYILKLRDRRGLPVKSSYASLFLGIAYRGIIEGLGSRVHDVESK